MRKWAGIVLAAALLTGMTACGGGDDGPKQGDEANGQEATEFGDLKPEDVRASGAEVADGFTELDRINTDLLAKLGTDAAPELQESLLTIWESILGSVKANDDAAYQRIDGALTILMDPKVEKAKAEDAAKNVHETGVAYLKKFPSTSTAPPSTASPSMTDTDGTTTSSGDSEDAGDEPGDSDVDSDLGPTDTDGGGLGY